MSELKELKGNISGFELCVKYPQEILIENNVQQLCDFIESRMKDYSPESYMGDSDMAKKDRTELNKGVEQVKQIRQSIAALNPYKVYTDKLMDAEKLMKKGSDALGEIVNVKTEEEKKAKYTRCVEIWNSKNFSVVGIDKVFNQKWLNKTTKEKDIEAEMDAIIEKIYKDLKAIDKFGLDAEIVKSVYIEKLDLGEAFDYAEELKKNREIAAKEKAERAERERLAKIEEQKKAEISEQLDINRSRDMSSIIDEALSGGESQEDLPFFSGSEPKAEIVKDDTSEYIISFTATKQQLLDVKNFLTANGIVYNSCKEVEF